MLERFDYVIAGGGSVYSTPGADDWLSLLEAMEQPHRSARVRAAALTTFFGHTAAELDAQGDVLTERVADTLRDWVELLRDRGTVLVSAPPGPSLPDPVLLADLSLTVAGNADGVWSFTRTFHVEQ